MDAIEDIGAVIDNPLKFVDDIFQRAELPLQSTAVDWGEETFLKDVAEAVKDKLEPIGEGLIRLCGMITESKGSEFYSGVYLDPDTNQVQSGKYRDSTPYDCSDEQSQRVFTREVFVLSKIPGSSDWLTSSNPFLNTERVYVKVLDQGRMHRVGQLVDIVGIRSRQCPSIIHQVWSQEFSLFPVSKPISSLLPVRADLIHFLAHSLGNDYRAAQYLLTHMVSRVHSRIPQQNVAIGNFPIHIQPLSDEATLTMSERIQGLYKLLLPFTTVMDVSIAALSSFTKISPHMDYEAEELISGPLHLAPGTVLILDQTKMESGKLEEHALRNLKTLQRLANEQILPFDFMYDIDFEVDIPILVMAKEKTTLIPTQYKIGIGGVDPLPEYVEYRIDDGILESWRQYIISARKTTVQLSEEISERAKKDFLDHKLKAENMHRILNFARLLSASYLESEITDAIWDEAFALEKQRSNNFSSETQ